MTDRIDLDSLDVETDDDEDAPNRGDWFWKGEGDPEDEPDVVGAAADPSGGESKTESKSGTDDGGAVDDRPIPHVPHSNKGKPAGIPVESGGAGGGAASDGDEAAAEAPEASGPHGGGVDEMTMALTYDAAKRLANPQLVMADAEGWADWVGIVGHVDAHVINKFLRDNGIDIDFFNGTGTGPSERLREIDRHSMFFAERMVVVGVDDDEAIADRADWEFVPLEVAATKADWELA